MSIDEAIKHAEEVAYQKDLESGFDTDNERYAMTDEERTACKECGEQHRQLAEWLKELKQLREQARWIPISEGCPKERDWYLGIFKEPDTGWINPIPYICDYVGCETAATTKEYWILNGFTDRDEHIDYYYNLECVAWQPLPEPYQEEKE